MRRMRLRDVRWRMELVTFLQGPTESLGERSCDRRLPAARNACDYEDCPKIGDVGLACGLHGWQLRAPRRCSRTANSITDLDHRSLNRPQAYSKELWFVPSRNRAPRLSITPANNLRADH